MTRLVVGLGNPGPEYEWTRHNVGFHVLDHLAGDTLFQTASKLARSEEYSGRRAFLWTRLSEPDAFLMKPQTYMNLSGEVVAPVARFLFGDKPDQLDQLDPVDLVDPGRILVVYDDMDLPFGTLRIRPHGGHGGQKGMRSIIECLGTDRFRRLRIGIGRPGTDAARHVLAKFGPDELEDAKISVAEAADAIRDWLGSGDIEGCMTRYHSRWTQGS